MDVGRRHCRYLRVVKLKDRHKKAQTKGGPLLGLKDRFGLGTPNLLPLRKVKTPGFSIYNLLLPYSEKPVLLR